MRERQGRATRPYGTSSADGEIDAVLRSEPPVEGASLSGWLTLAEWTKPDGERRLVLLGKPEASLLQMKSYLHSGLLNMVWSLYEPSEEPSETKP